MRSCYQERECEYQYQSDLHLVFARKGFVCPIELETFTAVVFPSAVWNDKSVVQSRSAAHRLSHWAVQETKIHRSAKILRLGAFPRFHTYRDIVTAWLQKDRRTNLEPVQLAVSE